MTKALPATLLTLLGTFAAAYLPHIVNFRELGNLTPAEILQQPDWLAGLLGFIFSISLTLGTSYYHRIHDQIAELNRKIDAQGEGQRVHEAYLRAHTGNYADLFGKLAKARIARLHKDLKGMARDQPYYVAQQNNPAKEFVDIFVRLMMDILEEGNEFRVISNLPVWAADNFGGADRRYLLANLKAAQERGIKITRIYALDPVDKIAADAQSAELILQTLEDHQATLGKGKNIDLLVCPFRSEEEHQSHFEEPSGNFALWRVAGKHPMCILVNYARNHAGQHRIDDILFTSSKELFWEKEVVFEDKKKRAIPLPSFIAELDAKLHEKPKANGTKPSAQTLNLEASQTPPS